MRSKRILFPLAAMALSAGAALLLLELLVRAGYSVRNRLDPPLAYISEDWGWRPTPDLSLVYTKDGYGEIVFTSTRDGFRRYGDPESSRTKVLAVGDSTTQAYQVSDGRAYYDFLAKEDPGFEVFAFGVGGYGTVQQALALARYLGEISPAVVIWQLSGNDWINNDWVLESLSNENNNHMRRPYLEEGRIVRRHPDRGLGWLAERSLLARRLAVLRSSLRKRRSGTIETELRLDQAALRRSLATTRRAVRKAIAAAPGVVFFAFMVPGPERHAWELDAFAELCASSALRCLPEVHEAVAAAARSGVRIDGGEDPHWNAAGHEIAGRVILDHLRRELAARPDRQVR